MQHVMFWLMFEIACEPFSAVLNTEHLYEKKRMLEMECILRGLFVGYDFLKKRFFDFVQYLLKRDISLIVYLHSVQGNENIFHILFSGYDVLSSIYFLFESFLRSQCKVLKKRRLYLKGF